MVNMKPKDKVWLIVQALLDRRDSDDEIIAHSGRSEEHTSELQSH